MSFCKKEILAATALALGVVWAASAQAQTFTTYDSGTPSEQYATLPGTNAKYAIYSVDVGPVSAGDILDITGEVEMTNDTGSPVRLSAQVVLASSSTGTSGTQVDNNNNFYITPDMHHGVRVKAGIVVVPSTADHLYVNFVCWANGLLTVESGLGKIQALKIGS
jgi:hypothetical protein